MGRILDKVAALFGYRLLPLHYDQLTYQHDYGPGGYTKYREIQIHHNKRKLNNVWADDKTLGFICEYLKSHIAVVRAGLCHGARNGYEQKRFGEILGCPVIGTDIAETATEFPNSVQWDYHEINPEWIGQFSFVYSNSLDQAFDPRRALSTWVDQLADGGLVFVEHTMAHSPSGAGEMDPFGAHPMVMPALIFEWGRGQYRLRDILHPPHRKIGDLAIWIFVIEKSS